MWRAGTTADLVSDNLRDQKVSGGRNPSIWRSWSWNESGGACDQEIWSEIDAEREISSSESETFSSCAVGCDATWEEVEAFGEEEKVCEAEDGSVESAQQKQ